LQAHTGWNPQIGFDDGLLRTFEWLRSCGG
jgi:nucleoside-diphosphate-sugar epimerase